MWGVIRAALPTRDAQQLAAHPEAVDKAVRIGVTHKTMADFITFVPPHLIDELTPVAANMFSTLFTQLLATFAATGATNWMLYFILTGKFALGQEAPPFLQPEVLSAAQKNGIGAQRVRFHTGKIQDKAVELARSEGGFDIVGLSNILQADKAVARDAVQKLKGALAPGGAMLCRGAGTADIFTECGLRVEPELNEKLRQLDLPHWDEIVVGFA